MTAPKPPLATNFIQFCREHKLSKDEAERCARFLSFIRREKEATHMKIAIDVEYKKKRVKP